MIRNAVLHINNEQPMLADLFELPEAGDVGLRCTNLRTMNGTRPIFVDAMGSVFFFPYAIMRFVEIPATSVEGTGLPMPVASAVEAPREPGLAQLDDGLDDDGDLEIDEDFLRRIREA